jgi:SAM-dependent methyltransferase
MKALIRKTANIFGYEIRRKTAEPSKVRYTPRETFHSYHYLRHNARRLEHLASLRIPVAGMTVLEVGAGIGDHSSYYIDRGCNITITEGREENLAILRNRYPGNNIVAMDMERPNTIERSSFEVVHCYGLLYHVRDPQRLLQFLAENCTKFLFLETCVSFGSDEKVNNVAEKTSDPSQALSGAGCRPTRKWIFNQLKNAFPYVYCSKTQPNHEEFPLDWTAPEKHKSMLQRSVFIASRLKLENEMLSEQLLEHQIRHE